MNHRHLVASAAALALPAAQAFDIETTDPDLKLRLDLTPKYSSALRLKNPSPSLVAFNPARDPGTLNEDDGDHNFKKGLISSRLDLLGELDISARNYGARLSANGWHDSAYLRANSYYGTPIVGAPVSISTANVYPGQAANEFLPATRRQHGQGSELLDAFAYAKGDIGGMKGTVRLGKHTLQWGESLFFGQNGIANAQGPVDVAKILSVPGWQFKEVLLPVEQLSGSLQAAEGVSLGAYYQFKWRPSKIPGVGSYFSNQDYVGTGIVNFGAGGALRYDPSKDLTPKDSGQGGVQLRWSPAGSAYEFGFYAANYHDKSPAVPVFDFVNGNVHLRCDTSTGNPCYAVGRTGHLQLSGIYVLQPNALWGGGAVVGELAYNNTLKVTRDIFAIGPGGTGVGLGGADPNTTRGAWALRMIFEPQYFQVLPGLDLSVPVGVGYNFGGRSSAIFNFAGGAANAGDYSIGLKGKYQNAWNMALSYTDYFGKAATFTQTLVTGAGSPRQLSYAQSLRDRAYLSFTLSRTF
ncbi:MAG: DUF1302 family protein [Burkholderiales bacterium]|nr:DUF1302 family protein [Burkholderiales bacterium]